MKGISSILKRPPPHWVGDCFNVYPVFHDKAFTKHMSPFLMFDYAAPKNFPPTNKKLGVGQHPHRGFETITIAFQGEVEHGDHLGNRDVIGSGDVQWMTAGRGIIHEEFHSRNFAKTGGTFEMCQLWLNLPAEHKMTSPKYQPILSKDIPSVPLVTTSTPNNLESKEVCDNDEGYVRIIAGEYNGHKGPATTFTPIDLLDIHISTTNKDYIIDSTEGFNVIVFVRDGKVKVQDKELGPQSVALMELKGTRTVISAVEPNSKVLILAGQPIDEPIAARGPFVMNTQQELQQAMLDYSTGNF